MAMTEKQLGKTGRPEGGDMVSSVRLDAKKKIVVNPEFSMSRIQVKELDPHEKNYRCCMCGRVFTKQLGNFVSGGASPLWKGNNGYLPFCKACCESLLNNLTSFYSGNEEHALRHMCGMFDWYYCDTTSAMTKAQVKLDGSRALLYPSKANTRQAISRGTTFLDTIRDEAAGNDVVDVEELPPDDDTDKFEVTREVVRNWGRGYTPEQYQYLEEQYKDWCAKNVCNTKTQEELYKNIAIAQLNIRTAQMHGNAKAVADAMNTLQQLMSSANILPKQTADNLLADTQTFGTLLEKYEKTRPIPEPSPEWRDVDGIRRYMNTWFRGGLGKALRIRNENTALYDEAVREMERYTVRKPSVSNAADGMGSAMFDSQNGDGSTVEGAPPADANGER